MSPEELPKTIDDIAYYHHLRGRIEHEDGLIVNRLAWLMASESFLFTAYAIVLNGTGTPQQRRLTDLIPLVAVATSALIFIGIVAAIRAMGWIRGLLEKRIPDPARLGLPPIHTPGSMKTGLAAPLLLPVMFVVVWLYLLVAGGR
jgi:hypothetical protein